MTRSSARVGALRRIYQPEEGMALVLVVGSMLLLMSFLLVGLTYAMSSTKFSRYNQDYTAAMAAAQAGVDDFISRLNRDDLYGRTIDCSNPAMATPAACGGGDYGWLPVSPGASPDRAPAFRYEVNTSNAFTNGTIMVKSTGRSNDVHRTIEVAVGKGGSTDYVYYTDYESLDPENPYYTSTPPAQCGSQGTDLARYHWQGRSSCTEIQFGVNDVLDGRVFSNDSIYSVGGRFLQGIESAFPDCRNVVSGTRSTWNRCLRSGSSYTATGSNATFGVAPRYATNLYLPDNSAEFANHPGCHYYGATRIVFHSNGTMTVWSKDSDFDGVVLAKADDEGNAPTTCGTREALKSPSGATVPVPSDMVIYAAPAPVGLVPRELIRPGSIDGTLPLGDYDPTYNSGVPGSAGHRTSGNPGTSQCDSNYRCYKMDKSMTDPRKFRGEGNVYIEGVIKGRVTVAAAQSVVVTGDLMLAGGLNGDDLLGLVATNTVEIMHPRLHTYLWTNCTRTNSSGSSCSQRGSWAYRDLRGDNAATYPPGTWPRRIADPTTGVVTPSTGIQIQGSIQTLQHSFAVQYFNVGRSRSSNGSIWVRGSIAQRYRGAVGTAGSPGTGYDKDYRYDTRLKYTAPPYFPHWVNAQWSLRYSGEVPTPDELLS